MDKCYAETFSRYAAEARRKCAAIEEKFEAFKKEFLSEPVKEMISVISSVSPRASYIATHRISDNDILLSITGNAKEPAFHVNPVMNSGREGNDMLFTHPSYDLLGWLPPDNDFEKKDYRETCDCFVFFKQRYLRHETGVNLLIEHAGELLQDLLKGYDRAVAKQNEEMKDLHDFFANADAHTKQIRITIQYI